MAQRPTDQRGVTIGIDFGTSFTRVTYYDPVTRETGLLRFGDQDGFRQYAIPSLAVRGNGQWLYGYEAEKYLTAGRWDVPPTPLRSLKRRLSRAGREGEFVEADGVEYKTTTVIAEFLGYVMK